MYLDWVCSQVRIQAELLGSLSDVCMLVTLVVLSLGLLGMIQGSGGSDEGSFMRDCMVNASSHWEVKHVETSRVCALSFSL